MFVIVLTHLAPLEQIDAALPAHAAWLDEQYRAGRFIVSGRQHPRTGGVILADGCTRAEIEQAVAADPFAIAGLSSHTVIEFVPSRTSDRWPSG